MSALPKEQDLVRERGEGRKDDAGKPRWELLPWDVVASVVRVFTLGAKTYGDFNWQEVKNARSRYFGAAMRHLTSWWEGELRDPQTGESHLAHAMCCLLILGWHDLNAVIVKPAEPISKCLGCGTRHESHESCSPRKPYPQTDGWCEATHHSPGGEVQAAHPKSSGCVNWGQVPPCDAVHHRPGPDGACR